MKVKEIKDLLAYCDDNAEVKIYVKDLNSKIQFWYFGIEEAKIKEDGLYIELN
jgi:hypothetical protein